MLANQQLAAALPDLVAKPEVADPYVWWLGSLFMYQVGECECRCTWRRESRAPLLAQQSQLDGERGSWAPLSTARNRLEATAFGALAIGIIDHRGYVKVFAGCDCYW